MSLIEGWIIMVFRRLLTILGLLWVLCFSAINLGPTTAYAQRKAQSEITFFYELVFERTMCFGTCPAYKITVNADGRVEYEGKAWVKTKGIATDRLSPDKIEQLLQALNKANFLSFRDSYASREDGCPTSWTCNPGVILSVEVYGQRKTIHHDHGCREEAAGGSRGEVYPRQLYLLAEKIDEIVETSRWVDTNMHERIP
jgi:hypothetical protein